MQDVRKRVWSSASDFQLSPIYLQGNENENETFKLMKLKMQLNLRILHAGRTLEGLVFRRKEKEKDF